MSEKRDREESRMRKNVERVRGERETDSEWKYRGREKRNGDRVEEWEKGGRDRVRGDIEDERESEERSGRDRARREGLRVRKKTEQRERAE